MNLRNLPIFSAMQEKMKWLNRREGVLAENVANANTPGYMPRDLNEPDFKGLLNQYTHHGVTLAMTQPGHMRGPESMFLTSTTSGVSFGADSISSGAAGGEKKLKPEEVQPNGNGVSVETQMAMMSDTQIQYSTLLDVYKKQIGMLNTVLKG